jgi:hypothetical protein
MATIADWVRNEAEKMIRRTLTDSVQNITVSTSKDTDPITGTKKHVICIGIEADNIELTMGQFMPFTPGSSTGFTLPMLRGWLLARAPAEMRLDVTQVVIDCMSLRSAQEQVNSTIYRYVDCRTLAKTLPSIKNGPLWNAVTKLNIRYFLMAGNLIAGPSLGMLNAVADATRQFSPRYVLDLFSGTGGLALAAIDAGANYVRSIDVFPPPEIETPRVLAAKAGFRWEYDVMSSSEALHQSTEADLVIADPFYSHTWSFVDSLLHRGNIPSFMILNGGRSCQHGALSRLEAALRGRGYNVGWTDSYGERVFRCALQR